MYALNTGYQWHWAHFADSLGAAVYLASGNDSQSMQRRNLAETRWRLFDPQLYLAGLDAEECGVTCGRLASHPWFMCDGVPEFDSDEHNVTSWRQEVRAEAAANWRGCAPAGREVARAAASAIDFQVKMECTHILLATPLIENEDGVENFARWLDAGLDHAVGSQVGSPSVACIALAEAALDEEAADPGEMLDAILAQVYARDDIEGVYIVVAQTEARHPFDTSDRVLRTYGHLVQAASAVGLPFVFTNFADVFGYACYGLGATGFASGRTLTERRLSLAAFRETLGGSALPSYYCHQLVTDFRPRRHLDRVAAVGLLDKVADLTRYCEDLFDAYGRGATSDEVATWVESRGNVAASGRHLVQKMIDESRVVSSLLKSKRWAIVRDWLTESESQRVEVFDRLHRAAVETPVVFADADRWLSLLREVRG